eukprot:TRINITY_DN5892_c0_g2_i1.p1 TRINITY_DN5892_c0_g2~~TRINITY_DN5892_c0_g2_i1.p1  ORF type:complete len:1004 (-),score=82.43 TRINITY_DN5892_c0_g2_i1:250-3261(-)
MHGSLSLTEFVSLWFTLIFRLSALSIQNESWGKYTSSNKLVYLTRHGAKCSDFDGMYTGLNISECGWARMIFHGGRRRGTTHDASADLYHGAYGCWSSCACDTCGDYCIIRHSTKTSAPEKTVYFHNGGSYSVHSFVYCKRCDHGRYRTSTDPATGCLACLPGRYANGFGNSACYDCTPGRFANGVGNSACYDCMPGFYASGNSNTACFACPEGKFSEAGKAQCVECPIGRYSPVPGADRCTSCGLGKFAAAGARTCEICPAGKFSNLMTQCFDCPSGTYANVSGADRCEVCPQGTFIGKGMLQCVACHVGTYSNQFGATQCTRCARGKFAAAGSRTCEGCPAGKYLDLQKNDVSDSTWRSSALLFELSSKDCQECGHFWTSEEFAMGDSSQCGYMTTLGIVLMILFSMILFGIGFSGGYILLGRPRVSKHEGVQSTNVALDCSLKPMRKSIVETVPSYWTNNTYAEKDGFDEMVFVDRNSHAHFDEMVSDTYKSIATQDRPCPNKTCAKTKGGCPCVRPGGVPGMPSGYKVHRVIRVEDSAMWSRYVAKRNAIKRRRIVGKSGLDSVEPPPITRKVAKKYVSTFEPLDRELNEVYLWHGTGIRVALAIVQEDFKINLAGSNAGIMYGRGAYFAESCTKADEYAVDEADSCYEGVFAFLLCRVCMGKFYYTTEREETAGDRVACGEFDSVVGDRAKSVRTFREFVVYQNDQMYPEYVVLYSRVDQHGALMSKNPRLSTNVFQTELPIYWANIHRNPRVETFYAQYVAGRATTDLLQRLIDAQMQGTGKSAAILSCRRVEHSVIWNRYVNFKGMLWDALQSSLERFPTPEDMNGDSSTGRVLTAMYLEKNERTDACLSLEHLEISLNEFLLWHGTTSKAVEEIVQKEFRIPKTKTEVKYGKRFGDGVYFAENLSKSLDYAPPKQGVQYVILCRVLCGRMYYTEKDIDKEAHEDAQQTSCHSVLAHPKQSKKLTNVREFIVHKSDQAYPEYVLELKVEERRLDTE